MTEPRAAVALWQSVRALPEFRRLLELRAVSSVRRRPVPGRAGRARCCSTPSAPPTPWADRRLLRRAVPAVFAARPVRGRTARPVGPPRGARRREPGPAGADARGRRSLLAVGAGDRPILLRRADRQRLHPVRRVRAVRGATARGAARAGGDDELGRHRRPARRRPSSAPTSCWCRAGCSAPATAGAAVGHLHRGGARRLALWLSVRFKPHVLGPDDTARAVHGSVAYAVATGWVYGAAHGARACRTRRRHAGRRWPPTGWCSASTRCWCWSSSGTPASRTSRVSAAAVLFVAATGVGSFLATFAHPGRGPTLGPVRHRQRRAARWPRSSSSAALGCTCR